MTVRSRTSGSGASSSSHAVSLSGLGVTTGDRLVVSFVNDQADTSAVDTHTGWTSLGTRAQGSNLGLTVLTRVATGSDSLTVTLTSAQEAAWTVTCLQGNGGTPETVQFADGAAATTGAVTAITGLASGDYDSIISVAIDNNGSPSHTITPATGPLAEGWGNLTTPGTNTAAVVVASVDRSATGATGFSPSAIEWSNADQWVTAHVVVPQASTGPVEKVGSDSGTGTDTGSVSTTSTSGDSATGAEAGSLALPGADSATGSESGYVSEAKLGGDVGEGTEAGTSSATVTTGEAATGAEAGTTSATVTPPTDTATGAEQGHIAIPGEDTAEGTDAHVPPTLVTVTTGEETTGTEGGYVETLFGDLIVSLFAVDPDTGALIALPDYESLDISRERNSRGAVRTQYPIDGKDFALLRSAITDSRDLEFELWTNGTPSGALRGYLQEAAGDDVVADDNGEDGSWQFAGSWLECRTDETIVFPQDRGALIVDPDTGDLVYTNPRRELIVNSDNPGELMLLLLQQAQDRGALTDIVAGFSTTHDSNGTPWNGVLTANFSPGSSYTQILDKLVQLGLAEWAIVWDWETQQKVFKLWVAEGRGADLTLGPRPVTLRRGRNLLDAPRKWSVRDSATTMLAAGAEGVYRDTTDATALARRDRRIEAYTSLNNAADEEAVLGWAQAQLSLVAPGFTSIEHGIGMLPGEPRPVIAFDIGDWVYSQTGTEPERLRVVQWTLTIDINRSLAGTVTLNDTVQDAIERLQERLDAISSGEAVVGTSDPGAQTEDRTPPAAPQGLVASSIAYQDPEMTGGAAAQTLAFVTVGWNVVTTNADGADSPLVQAAVFILDKLEEEELNPEVPDPDQEDGGPSYDPIQADWTWRNCPQVVRDFADNVQMVWNDDGNPPAIPWLTDYIAEQTQTPTAAEDVAGYDVRYAYLGLEQVGGIPSSDPFPEDERFYYPATPPQGTSSNQYSFGGVEGGSRLRIEVRAFDRRGNYGAWSEISHDTEADVTPPPVPSPPTGLKTTFRTLLIPWDGLGSEGEPMPVDFAHARVWVGQGADLTLPAEPVTGPVAFDPLVTTPQYVADIKLGAGTAAIPGLPYGVGWYARLQAVDNTGNASAGSAVIGPVTAEQLFPDDLRDSIINHPDLIAFQVVDTQHVVDAAIIGAKIATATIEEAHIASVNAGSITTGTLSATVTVTGSLATSLSVADSRLVLSGAGLQLYRTNGVGGSDLVGEWRTSDGSMLVTGTLRSNLSGTRIHVDPDGSLRFYPPSGTNFSQITNRAGEAVWRGPLDANQRSGRVNVNILGVGLNFSAEEDLLENIRSEIVVFDRRARITAPFVAFEVDERNTNPSGGDRRVQFATLDSSGNPRSNSFLSYQPSQGSNSNRGALVGNTVGLVFMGGGGESARLEVRHATSGWGSWLNVHATSLVAESSGTVKTDIKDIRAALNPMEAIRGARARTFSQETAPTSAPRVGVIAEELPEIIVNHDTGIPGVDLVQQVGVLWGAFNQLLDQESRSVTGRALLPNRTYRAGDTIDLVVPWDETPLEVPSSVTAMALASMPTAMGKIRARIVPGTATLTGATIRLTFEGVAAAVVVTAALPIAVEAIGRYIWTPPYIPEEA